MTDHSPEDGGDAAANILKLSPKRGLKAIGRMTL